MRHASGRGGRGRHGCGVAVGHISGRSLVCIFHTHPPPSSFPSMFGKTHAPRGAEKKVGMCGSEEEGKAVPLSDKASHLSGVQGTGATTQVRHMAVAPTPASLAPARSPATRVRAAEGDVRGKRLGASRRVVPDALWAPRASRIAPRRRPPGATPGAIVRAHLRLRTHPLTRPATPFACFARVPCPMCLPQYKR